MHTAELCSSVVVCALVFSLVVNSFTLQRRPCLLSNPTSVRREYSAVWPTPFCTYMGGGASSADASSSLAFEWSAELACTWPWFLSWPPCLHKEQTLKLSPKGKMATVHSLSCKGGSHGFVHRQTKKTASMRTKRQQRGVLSRKVELSPRAC